MASQDQKAFWNDGGNKQVNHEESSCVNFRALLMFGKKWFVLSLCHT